MRSGPWLGLALTAGGLLLGACGEGAGHTPAQAIPNLGKQITPLAPSNSRFEGLNPGLSDNPDWLAGQAVTTVVSPDHKTLLVLTSGFNRIYKPDGTINVPDSTEYVFVYDIGQGSPVRKQVLQIPNTYNGIVFDPSGTAFYVSGGMGDRPYNYPGAVDNVHIFIASPTGDGTWQDTKAPLIVGHTSGVGLNVQATAGTGVNLLASVNPCAAGVAISNDGQTLVVADYYNDSVTVFTGGLGHWSAAVHRDLRPGKSGGIPGTAGGEYPFWVSIKGTGSGTTAYVSSVRDREVVVVNVGMPGAPSVVGRIPVKGQPNKMTLNAAQSFLYVVEDESDTVDVIDTARNAIVETIPVIAPAAALPAALAHYTGDNTNSVTLSPDESELYVTDGNLNAIAVVALGGKQSGDHVVGLIPTGWYPNSVSFSGDGKWVYAVNGKSPTGANPEDCYGSAPSLSSGLPGAHKNCLPANEYNPQRIKAGLQSFPRPGADQLASLTALAIHNNRFSSTESASDAAVMAAVHRGVRHVIFIIKENRSYDQILGDLELGNGDPALAEFGQAWTPNQHNLARNFVTLDNFMDSSETSNDGWPWTTSARAPDVIERQFPVLYGARGLSLDSEGVNRNINVAIRDPAARVAANPLTPSDPDVLAGTTDTAAPDGPDNEINTGYLWDSALRAGLSVRNYGFFVDTTLYPVTPMTPADSTVPVTPIPLERNPALTTPPTVVAIPASVSLTPYTDPYFRGFDNQFPDYYRYTEWAREFDGYISSGQLPALSLVRLMHDHTGDFAHAIDGINTPELQQADNDYAVGLLVQKVANSRYASDTLILIVEDDSQDAGDHVDSHRSVLFVAGAYVKQNALVSTPYNTVNLVRTIEEVLGLAPMNLNDAVAQPMADLFTTTPKAWSFVAVPSPALCATALVQGISPAPCAGLAAKAPAPKHDSRYWARVTRGMNFASEDKMDFARYNRVLWNGIMGDQPYPAARGGKDLRHNRAQLLTAYRMSQQKAVGALPAN